MIAFLPPLIPPNHSVQDLVLRVDEVVGRYDRGQFAGAARRLYRGDRRWTPPLGSARREALRGRGVLLPGGVEDDLEVGAFLGIAQNLGLGDEPVGSIAAWSTGGRDEYGPATWGAWGLFESINAEEMADRLFAEAETWLFEHGGPLAGIYGPMTLEPLCSPGLLTDGFDAEPAALLPYNPPYYPEMIEAQGYEPRSTWRAYVVETGGRASEREGTVLPDAWREVFNAYAVHRQAQRDEPDLVPGLVDWLSYLAGEQARFGTRDWQWTLNRAARYALRVRLDDKGGDEAACFGIPDFAPALRRVNGRLLPFGWLFFRLALLRTSRLRVFPAAVPARWPWQRLAELYADLMRRAAQAGYRQMIIAPVSDEDERSITAMTRLAARPTQRFTLYEKRF